MNKDVILLEGTGLYYQTTECFKSLFADFAIRNGFPFSDLDLTYGENESHYFTLNEEDMSIKFVLHKEEGDLPVKEWKDPLVCNAFLAFGELYRYYSRKETSND